MPFKFGMNADHVGFIDIGIWNGSIRPSSSMEKRKTL